MEHTLRIKVRGYHCDFYGHVNNARYLEFLEEARWSYLETGLDLQEWKRRGLGFVVTAVTIRYLRPAGLNTVLEVRSQMAAVGERRGVINQEVADTADGKLVAAAEVTFAVVDLTTGRGVPLSGEIAEILEHGLAGPPAGGPGDDGEES